MTWEERWHPLRREWVVVAAHRQNRPWNSEEVSHAQRHTPAYVKDCHLCPSNTRVSGVVNEGNLLKYLAGPEIGAGGFISDTAPEDKARELLAVPTVHYKRAAAGSPGNGP